jgi:chromosome segregation ATPase
MPLPLERMAKGGRMAAQLPQLKRGLFGYRPKTVRLILAGREIMFAKLWQRLGRTEAELARTRAELETSRGEVHGHVERARLAEEEAARQSEQAEASRVHVAELQAEIHTLRDRLQRLEAELVVAESGPEGADQGSAQEELSTILESAEEAFTRMIERARLRNEEQLREVDTARQELRSEVERLAAWRADVERLLGSVRETVAHTRAQIQETPERLRGALSPTTEAMASVNDTLEELARATEQLHGAHQANEFTTGVPWNVAIPETSNGSDGTVAEDDLAAIQEQYGER